MLLFRSHYNKALRVINSCINLYQVSSAERYIQNLIKLYTVSSKNGIYEFESDEIVEHINYLNKKVEEKKLKLFSK